MSTEERDAQAILDEMSDAILDTFGDQNTATEPKEESTLISGSALLTGQYL